MRPDVVLPARKVWVLMFDQSQTEDADQKNANPAADSESTISNDLILDAFEDLELQSSFFEQYMLQDTRTTASLADVLGGNAVMARFTAGIRAANKSACVLRLTCASEGSGPFELLQPTESLVSDQGTLLPLIERMIPAIGNFDDSVFRDDSQLRSALATDLVWIEVQTGLAENKELAADRILRLVRQLRSEALPTTSPLPILIVFPVRGRQREVAAPFSPGLCDSEMHVPLWIEHGAGHACRIQALTGSFDLLPTLNEYLTGTQPLAPETASAIRSLPDESAPLGSKPISLVSACENRTLLPDRLLCLAGNSWNAYRTQQYLLVHASLQESLSDAAIPSPDEKLRTVRRLFLKPDDVWNVNDAIVAYAEIASQMELAAAESVRNTG